MIAEGGSPGASALGYDWPRAGPAGKSQGPTPCAAPLSAFAMSLGAACRGKMNEVRLRAFSLGLAGSRLDSIARKWRQLLNGLLRLRCPTPFPAAASVSISTLT